MEKNFDFYVLVGTDKEGVKHLMKVAKVAVYHKNTGKNIYVYSIIDWNNAEVYTAKSFQDVKDTLDRNISFAQEVTENTAATPFMPNNFLTWMFEIVGINVPM